MNISHQRIDLKVIRLDQTSPWPALQIDRSRLSQGLVSCTRSSTRELSSSHVWSQVCASCLRPLFFLPFLFLFILHSPSLELFLPLFKRNPRRLRSEINMSTPHAEGCGFAEHLYRPYVYKNILCSRTIILQMKILRDTRFSGPR